MLVDVAARTGVSPRAVVSLVVLAALVIGLLTLRLTLARSRAEPTPIAALPALASGPASPAAPAASTAPSASGASATAVASPTPTAAQVVVHVVGQVRHAGVVRLPSGSRVQDAVAAAGGARTGADLSAVNLARLLVDGEQVVVPKPGQVVAGPASPLGGSTGGGSAAAVLPAGPVDLNSANEGQLDALPGVGQVLAGRILDWRAQHGRFSSVDELSEVSGIGEKMLERLRPLVRV